MAIFNWFIFFVGLILLVLIFLKIFKNNIYGKKKDIVTFYLAIFLKHIKQG
jgi:hypothetical protein